MKIGVFSDTHLGFDEKGVREREAFSNLEQALEICVNENADVVLHAGDFFDSANPSHDVLFKAMKSLSTAKKGNCVVSLSLEKENEKKQISCNGLPVVAIHGNHEYRGKESKSALNVLELAGLLVYFHAGKVFAEKDGEKICIHGLGAVPEKKALEVLNFWKPKPEENCLNILMLHQTFKEFLCIDDEMVATLSLDDLPKGFDFIVNGHLHWSNEQKIGDQTFLLSGSTIATSIKRLESEKPKGVYFYDTSSKELSFKDLPNQRKMFYHKIVFDNADLETVSLKCKEAISQSLVAEQELAPLIRLNLKGTLKKGLSGADFSLKEILDEYSERALLSISKNFSGVSFKKKISELREMQHSRKSVASVGFELLEKNLGETDFGSEISAKKLFDFLAENDVDSASKLILPEKD